jgi:hypothetical protein
MEALLRAFAMLWSAVAATFQMNPSRRARECDTPPAPVTLPGRTRDPIKENNFAAASSQPQEALMVSSTRSVRPSNHEGGLTAASHKPAHQVDCHPGSAACRAEAERRRRKRCPGPIPRQSDSQIHGSRLSSAYALPAGMTLWMFANSRDQRA